MNDIPKTSRLFQSTLVTQPLELIGIYMIYRHCSRWPSELVSIVPLYDMSYLQRFCINL